jgi:hypothetical protein
MKSSINKFSKGLVQDLADINQSNKSYSDSMNGSLIYNDNSNYDWVISNGNKLSFTLTPDNGTDSSQYFPIGAVGNTDIKVIFSVNDSNPVDIRSEIGLFSSDENGNGTYKTLFNDRAIPFINRLQFRKTNQIEARFLYENDSIIRVYWVDGIQTNSNPPRVFTFKYDGGGKGVATNYSAVTTSIHSINIQALFNPGIIKYVQKIGGTLLTGSYQYVYRLITNDGYATPWTVPTRRSFLTSDEVNATDWNLYEMEGSGIPTSKGNRIQIKGIDTRYKDIQVAYIYCKTELVVDETTIFTKVPISGQTMTFDHINMFGEPIVAETIASSFAGIKAAKTLDAKDSVLYFGNIIEGVNNLTDAEKDAVVANVTLRPIFKHMRSDELDNNRTQSPITHQTPKTGTATKVFNTSQTETYVINGDYVNYKGTQVEKEFTGYWRGETYRLAIVCIDNIGIPVFAIHLGDITLPEQTSLDYSWRRLRADGVTIDTGSGSLAEYPWLTDNFSAIAGSNLWDQDSTSVTISKIRIMGIEVSGINLSGVKNKISGYHIVRADRDATILAQGLIMPCISDVAPGAGGDQLTRPLHTVSQRWLDVTSNSLFASPNPAGITHNNYLRQNGGSDDKYGVRSLMTSFICPDYDFDQQFIPTLQTGDKLRIVSSSFSKSNYDPNTGTGPGELFGNKQDRLWFTYYNWRTNNNMNKGGQHTLSKQYYSKNQYHFNGTRAGGYPAYLNEAEIVQDVYMQRGEKKVYFPIAPGPFYLDNNTFFQIDDEDETRNPEGYSVGFDDAFYKGKEKSTMYYRTGNWNVPVATYATFAPFFNQNFIGNSYPHGGLLANYVRPNPSPYGGLTSTSMEQTIFYSTGHFQPVNNTTFTAPPSDIYSGAEVWGGDCYVDYIAFLRTYPWYWGSGREKGITADLETDIAHGIVMPYESILNYALRQAPSASNPMYPIVGALPEDSFDGENPAKPWSGGLWDEPGTGSLIEEFDVNGVLLQKELLKFFNTEPQDFNLINKFPVRWRYTGDKIYGDIIDYWRQFLAFDFRDLTGLYGQITSSAYFSNQIYSYQESAFGRLRASDKAVLNSTIGGLTTGTGAKLDGIDYISTKSGNQHQFSLVNSGQSLYWVDVDKRKGMRFAGDGRVSLTDIRGLHTFFKKECSAFYNKDNPAGGSGICGVFDYENNNLMWTFVRDYHRSLPSTIYIDSVNSVNTSYYENNNTIFVNGSGGAIVFPQTSFSGSTNDSTVYYVANKLGGSSVVLQTALASPSTVTTIATVNSGQYYEVKRDNKTSAWTATLVTLKDISPYRCTVQYNEDLNEFTGFFAYRPTFYWDFKNLFFSHDKDFAAIGNKYYAHNLNIKKANYYGQDYKSYISVNVNQDDYASKVFDTVRLNFNKRGSIDYTRFLFNTEDQCYYYDVQNDSRKKYAEDSMRMPVRTFNQLDRTRGKWINFIFEFKNNDDVPVKLYNLITNYRPSNIL